MNDVYHQADGRADRASGSGICLICSAYAHGASGQTIVLDALTGGDRQVVLVALRLGQGLDQVSAHFAETIVVVEGELYQFRSGHQTWTDDTLRASSAIFNRVGGLIRDIDRRSRLVARRLRGRTFAAVVGCSGDHADLAVAAGVARRLDLPFIAYLFDDPVYQWSDERLERPLALLLERAWAPQAAAILVPNEELGQAVYTRNEDLEIARPIIVRNPAERDVSLVAPPVPPKPSDEPWVIAYTGSVYHAQADAFRNLVQALTWVDEPWELHVASHQDAEMLHRSGLEGPHVRFLGQLSRAESISLQRGADALFLPLAFETVPDVIRTSAPLKTGEYLASGRPILVHAPFQSWLSQFFRAHGCGYVVDQPDVPQLAAALLRLRQDEGLGRRLASRQLEVARDFTLESSHRQFWSVVDGCADGASE